MELSELPEDQKAYKPYSDSTYMGQYQTMLPCMCTVNILKMPIYYDRSLTKYGRLLFKTFFI